jgi:hypothetical protein
MVTVVDDRESDIYATWPRVPAAGCHILTRVMRDRRLATGGKLSAAARGFPATGRRTIELRPHELGQAKRGAVLEMRHGAAEICRPQNENRRLPESVPLRLVEVREVDPPADCRAGALAAADDA